MAVGHCLSEEVETARLSALQVLAHLGTDAQLEVIEPGGEPGLTYQWFKDGRAIPGANQPVLNLNSMQPSHAGYYRVHVRAGLRQWRSDPTPVVVYDEVLKVTSKAHYDKPLIVNASVWGPAQIQWRGNDRIFGYPNDDLVESWCVQGVRNRQLSISHPQAVPASMVALISVGSDYVTTQVLSSDTVDNLARIAPMFVNSPRDVVVNVGDDVEAGPRYLAWYDSETQSARVRGLPLGLTFDPVGVAVTGTVSVAGTYPLTWEIWDRARLLAQATSFLTVQNPAKPSTFVHPGLYACEIPPDSGADPFISKGGYLELHASMSGSFSGLLRLGMSQWRFPSALKWQDESLTSVLKLPPPPGFKELKVTFERTEYFHIAATVELIRVDEESVLPYVDLRPERDFALVDPLRHRGPFACLLDNYGNDAGVDMPCTSFMTLRPVQKLSRLNAVGTLLNGTGFTMSMPVTSEPSDIQVSLHGIFYRPPSKEGEILSGVVRLSNSTEGRLTEPVISGDILWDPVNTPRSQWMPHLTAPSYLHAEGDVLYQPRVATPLLTHAEDLVNARVTLALPPEYAEALDLAEEYFQITAAGRAVFSKNKRKFQLDIYRPTGFFTGSFLLGPAEGFSGPPRKVYFQGLFVPGLQRGGGFFTMPIPGGTLGKLTSGLVSILPPRW